MARRSGYDRYSEHSHSLIRSQGTPDHPALERIIDDAGGRFREVFTHDEADVVGLIAEVRFPHDRVLQIGRGNRTVVDAVGD